MLFEHARISNNVEDFEQKVGKVEVFGGGYDGNQKEHNPPHFRITKNDGTLFRVKIPLVDKTDLTLDNIVLLDGKTESTKTKKHQH